ncbi:MAG: M48 family metalloprotease [Bacteriovoracaceae bacterium]|nr:M48 family metalloprotease [Bacteriovoracaceae bacterium]
MIKKLFLITLLSVTACATEKTRYREGNNEGQKAALTVEEEKNLTKESLAEMKKDYPPAKNAELQAYINKLGQKIVRANKLSNNPYTYTFTVVDVKDINAFALPAGSIFMTAPIIAMAESEAEIAGVLGHEIGHVTARHTAERMYMAKKEEGKTWVFGGIGAALGGTAGYLLSSKLCDPKDLACKAKYTAYGAGAGGVGGLMIQKYGFMKNSQEDELESDRVGFRYAANAGYDKAKVGDFYRKLQAMEEASKKNQNAVMGWVADAMASHPPSKARVSQAEEMKTLIKTTGGVTVTPEFLRMKKLAQQVVDQNKSK